MSLNDKKILKNFNFYIKMIDPHKLEDNNNGNNNKKVNIFQVKKPIVVKDYNISGSLNNTRQEEHFDESSFISDTKHITNKNKNIFNDNNLIIDFSEDNVEKNCHSSIFDLNFSKNILSIKNKENNNYNSLISNQGNNHINCDIINEVVDYKKFFFFNLENINNFLREVSQINKMNINLLNCNYDEINYDKCKYLLDCISKIKK